MKSIWQREHFRTFILGWIATALWTANALYARDEIVTLLWQFLPFAFPLLADYLNLSLLTLAFYFPYAMEAAHVLLPWLPTAGYIFLLRLWWQRDLQFRWKAGYWGR